MNDEKELGRRTISEYALILRRGRMRAKGNPGNDGVKENNLEKYFQIGPPHMTFQKNSRKFEETRF